MRELDQLFERVDDESKANRQDPPKLAKTTSTQSSVDVRRAFEQATGTSETQLRRLDNSTFLLHT
jgi:hypothetical protein